MIANTKGFTGHAMGAGIEDVVAVKALETGIVPPVANFKEVDPELGALNLSKGGAYPVRYALRLARRIRLADQHDAAALDAAARRPAPRPGRSSATPTASIDSGAWQRWLDAVAATPAAELEVVQRTLRVVDRGRRRVPRRSSGPVPYAGARRAGRRAAPGRRAVAASARGARAVAGVPSVAVQAGRCTTRRAPMPVKERVLALVAEKTGYPADMLDLDLDLEADLGVDTVKQAEVFAAIREALRHRARREPEAARLPDACATSIGFVRDQRGPTCGAEPGAGDRRGAAPAPTRRRIRRPTAAPRCADEVSQR